MDTTLQPATRRQESPRLDVIRGHVKSTKPLLVIIDPLVAFLGEKVDLHRSNEVRPVFAGLAAIAEEHGCAMIVVHHVNKSGSQRTILRAAGSLDIMAAVRSAHLFGVSSVDETQRAMIPVKKNLTGKQSAMGYRITEDGEFSWTGPSRLTPKDVLDSDGGQPALQEAMVFLRRKLQNGPRRAKDIRNDADAHMIAPATLRRAFAELGVVATPVYRTGKGKGVSHWIWELPQPVDFGDQNSVST